MRGHMDWNKVDFLAAFVGVDELIFTSDAAFCFLGELGGEA